jgi:hypothetical protein
MNWSELILNPCWTPLQTFVERPVHIHDDLYQVGFNVYARALSYDSSFKADLPTRPFVTILYWANTIEAAQRCVLHDISKPICDIGIPPAELLSGTNGSYSELLECAKKEKNPKLIESAIYSGNTGDFVHKIIVYKYFTYCFLDHAVYEQETPYAIQIALR